MIDGDHGDITVQSGGALFTSTAAQALKETLEHITNEQQQKWCESVSQQYPRWLYLNQMGVSAEQRFIYKNGAWILPPGHDEQLAPVAAVKRCTCGGESVGGGHSHWCDIV